MRTQTATIEKVESREAAQATRGAMRRNEYYSDRKMRFVFEVSAIQLLEAKAGEPDFDLEDMRFCYACRRWFDAAYFISTIEHEGQADFVCERCASEFEKLNGADKADFLRRCDNEFRHWVEELRLSREVNAA